MSYSDNFPAQRPIFTLDAANAGRLDPRMTFTRSDTPPTYAAPSAVHYWSNEKHLSSYNAFTKSEGLSNWTLNNVTPTANAVVAPDGNTTADTITGDSGTSQKYVQSNTAYDDNPVISVYAKAGTHNFIQIITNYSTGHYANFDLTSGAGAVGDVGAATTATIQAVGSTGWYRCVARFTVTGSSYVGRVVLVDSSTSARFASSATTGTVHLWGAMANNQGDLTNIVAYQPSTGQIHREYAPTLKSVTTAGQPRFEYDPASDGQSAGTSLGILVEGQSTNLNPYSDALASWTTSSDVTLTSNASLGPDGTLGADLMVANTNNTGHYVRSSGITVSASTSYTLSGYFKSVNGEKVRLSFFRGSSPYTGEASVKFTLSGTGSVSASIGSGTITSVGNGWYRCTATGTTLTTNSLIQVSTVSTGDAQDYAGNSYNGVLCAGIQFESGSHCSSLISTSGSAATRASDNLSVATADIGYTGGPVTIVTEIDGVQGSYPRAFALSDGTSSNVIEVHGDSASSTPATGWYAYAAVGGVIYVVNANIPSSAGATKLAISYDTNDVAYNADGNTPGADTAATFPGGLTTLSIGVQANGTSNQLNGHVKRVALYGEALSDANLVSLTS